MFLENYRYIYPVPEHLSSRQHKETRLQQRAKVIWITGLSGSGKTTLSTLLEQELASRGFLSQVLDGDNVRNGISNNLGFQHEDRVENIRRVAEVSRLMLHCGVITICACISPTEKIRQMAYKIIGKEDVIEIFTNSPLKVCEQRDPKGLYNKARMGKIQNFTGIHAPFEHPSSPDLVINTDQESATASLDRMLQTILPIITL